MNRSKKIYSLSNLASAIFMIAALLWLTVSIAFIYPSQQQLNKNDKATTAQTCGEAEDDNCDPFGNTNEEKASGNNTSFSEEYLHEYQATDHFLFTISKIHTSKNSSTYNAFHGEVHVPPPNIA